MTHAMRLIGVAFLAAILAGCATPAPRPPTTAVPAALPDGGCERRFTITNRSQVVLSEFYYRPAGAAEWGPDRFVARQLASNQSMSYRIVGPGMHDLRAVWANNREARLNNVDLCQAGLIVADDRGLAPR